MFKIIRAELADGSGERLSGEGKASVNHTLKRFADASDDCVLHLISEGSHKTVIIRAAGELFFRDK